MTTKELFVLRIAVSIERAPEPTEAESVAQEQEKAARPPSMPDRALSTTGPQPAPRPFRGRDNDPTGARQGDDRGMSEAQRKALFRLAFDLGDRDGVLQRVLDALGVRRLEEATRAQASRAIDALKNKGNGHAQKPLNGAGHA